MEWGFAEGKNLWTALDGDGPERKALDSCLDSNGLRMGNNDCLTGFPGTAFSFPPCREVFGNLSIRF
jgi:hypothetical protein